MSHPRAGRIVRIHYAVKWLAVIQPGLQDALARVLAPAPRKGRPRNHLVELLDDGRKVFIPVGNINTIQGEKHGGNYERGSGTDSR